MPPDAKTAAYSNPGDRVRAPVKWDGDSVIYFRGPVGIGNGLPEESALVATLFLELLPYGLNNLHRCIVGMTSSTTCRKYQFVVASPKTVSIAYRRPRVEI
jgi:hypothetical protein